MRHIRFTTALLTVSLAVFVVGGAAQKSQENSQNQNTQGQTTPGMMGGGMMGQGMGQGQGGMMSGGMMGGMGQMKKIPKR
jgi:hypothetical protein